MLRFLRKLLPDRGDAPKTPGPGEVVSPSSSEEPSSQGESGRRGELDPDVAEFGNFDWSTIHPPADLHDVDGWNRFWQVRLDQRLLLRMEEGLDVAFCRSQLQHLVDAMRANALRSVLCAGAGLAGEPHALAYAGCTVTVLDLSPLAVQVASTRKSPPDAMERYFERPCQAPGGSVTYQVGDFFDPQAAPGPFDVVIERRTLQLWSGQEFQKAIDAITARLAPRGIFVSHVHLGGWRPGESRDHKAEPWLRAHEFAILQTQPKDPSTLQLAGRQAWLMVTSG